MLENSSLGRVWSTHVMLGLKEEASVSDFAAVQDALLPWRGVVTPHFPRRPNRDQAFLDAGLDRMFRVELPPGTDTPQLVTVLSGLPGVEFAEVDPVGEFAFARPDDPNLSAQWHLENTGQSAGGTPGTPGADIRWVAAWPDIQGLLPVRVAVVDTGVSESHPDLTGALELGYCALTNCTSTDDVLSASHGTYCAGILGARTNNTIGCSGVAPNARIIPIKVSTGSFASQSTAALGINEAVIRGARVISMSIGWSSETTTLRSTIDAATAAGVLIFCSAGNTPGAPVNFPARSPNVIGVGATNNLDQVWNGSTTGAEMDICAPGAYILAPADQSSVVNGYLAVSGTSMATPMVAGTAALIWGINPDLTAADVRTILETSADDLGAPGRDSVFGAGRLNVHRAVVAAYATVQDCVVDIDGDGVATSDDILIFLNAWFTEVGTAGGSTDFDGDDDIDPDDLFSFLTAWFSGC